MLVLRFELVNKAIKFIDVTYCPANPDKGHIYVIYDQGYINAAFYKYMYNQNNHDAQFHTVGTEQIPIKPIVDVSTIVELDKVTTEMPCTVLNNLTNVVEFLYYVSGEVNRLTYKEVPYCSAGYYVHHVSSYYPFREMKLMHGRFFTGVSCKNGKYYVFDKLVKNTPSTTNHLAEILNVMINIRFKVIGIMQ